MGYVKDVIKNIKGYENSYIKNCERGFNNMMLKKFSYILLNFNLNYF